MAPSDLVQDTFLQALEQFHTFQGDSMEELCAWLTMILTHTTLNQLRQSGRKDRRTGREVALSALTSESSLHHVAPAAAQVAADLEQTRSVQKAFGWLSGEHRQVVELQLDGCSWEEIGRLTNRSADAARHLYSRAVHELKKALLGLGCDSD